MKSRLLNTSSPHSTYFVHILLLLVIMLTHASCDTVFEDDLSNDCVVLINPQNNDELSNSTVQFSWEGIDETLSYSIQIAEPSFSSSASIIICDLDTLTTTLNKELYQGNFEWRVKASNSSSETDYTSASFSVNGNNDLTDLSVSITSPVSNGFTADSLTLCSWNTLSGAADYTIRIYEYDNNIQGDLVNLNSTTNTELLVPLPEGRFLLALQASNGGTQFSQISQLAFNVDRTPPSFPNLIGPNLDIYNASEDITFSWDSGVDSSNSIIDSLFIYSVTPDELVYENEVQSPFTLSATDLGVGIYDWLIVTYDAAGNYSSSEYFEFTISE